ncbi:type I restriction endonuclease subunit R [Candidatus Mycoplasma haematohominis]|uniref:Type I restriction enzyme endonuclease subunit n=1 Tax=Candidatus Mycoplasma haematohominis TaxID=1494318 RepID=A0A478FR49_9MOLU|nr:type I restriction endonuclease subunit R [Candidatus Mycoplasma haemohominis]GCE63627.1 type I restriction enzyme EcoR124II R protein [Candidatus Mycoplasma haemohominis]
MSHFKETVCQEYFFSYQDDDSGDEEDSDEKIIRELTEHGIKYESKITNNEELIKNLREQLERLNEIKLSDEEWREIYSKLTNKSREEKLEVIHRNRWMIDSLRLKSGGIKNIHLLDLQNIEKNAFQFIKQFPDKDNSFSNEVTILINGLPLIQIELVDKNISIKAAFNKKIKNIYIPSSKLFEYIQIFIISNGKETKYYSSTNRPDINTKSRNASFEFTIYWSDQANEKIKVFSDFSVHFLNPEVLYSMLTKYSLLNAQNELLVLRPYQICATEKILKKIHSSIIRGLKTSKETGGYIWHSTGSGKTLTSFKASQLAKDIEQVDQVIFVVDRRELNKQIIDEFEKYEKGSTNAINNTQDLLEKLLQENDEKIIVTTIQRLTRLIKEAKSANDKQSKKTITSEKHEKYEKLLSRFEDKRFVLIFDECHRSQAGRMREAIIETFKNSHLFGFTGTPIFHNQKDPKKVNKSSTENLFGKELHRYSIDDAIKDGNVLKFTVDYLHAKIINLSDDSKKSTINQDPTYKHPKKITAIAKYILDNFDRVTCRGQEQSIAAKRRIGFNSIFATDSIESAKAYYLEFKKQQEGKKEPLIITTIFSNSCEKEEIDESKDLPPTSKLSIKNKDFLKEVIEDYNQTFKTSFKIDKFDNFQYDVSERLKNKEIDMLIVVNMFLTGFDSKTLNTIWIDKNVEMHNLVQAFSRTNRILDAAKPAGNVVCFRHNAEKNVAKAFKIYLKDSKKSKDRFLSVLSDYPAVYERYKSSAYKLNEIMVDVIEEPSAFIEQCHELWEAKSILRGFDEFKEAEKIIDDQKEKQLKKYYLALMETETTINTPKPENKKSSPEENELDFVVEYLKQEEIDFKYLNNLMEEWSEQEREGEVNKVWEKIEDLLDYSINLKDFKGYIISYRDAVRAGIAPVKFKKWVKKQIDQDANRVANKEGLDEAYLQEIILVWIKNKNFDLSGGKIDRLLIKPMSRQAEFRQERREKIERIIRELFELFNKYYFIFEDEDFPEEE